MKKERKKIEKEIFTKEFKQFCDKKFGKSMQGLEKERIKALILSKVAWGISILLSAPLFFFSFNNNESDLAKIGLGIITMGGLIASVVIKCFQNKAKKIILPKLLSFVGDFKQIKLDAQTKTNEIDYIKKLKLFNDFNDWSMDDCIDGTYNNLGIKIREIDLKKITGSGKNRHEEKIFKGILVKVPSYKPFNGFTIVKKNGERCKHGEKIQLEDVEFEKLFDVKGSNQIESRFLLTTAFMQRMVELQKKIEIVPITLSFEYNYINIAVHSQKDWFEVSVNKKTTDISNYRGIILDILTILSIIDTLKLEQDIGL